MKTGMRNEEGDDVDDEVKGRMKEGVKTMKTKEVKIMIETKQETIL